MNPNLLYWLKKTPRPVAILADGQRIEVTNNARGWKDLAATVKALDPSKLTALDGKGSILRTVELQTDEEEAPTPTAADAPIEDANTRVLIKFGELLAAAYDRGAVANQPVIDNAMRFVDSQSAARVRADTEIERLRGIIHRQNLQIAELSNAPPPEEGGGIVGALMSGVLQGEAARAARTIVQPAAVDANGSNGKGKKS